MHAGLGDLDQSITFFNIARCRPKREVLLSLRRQTITGLQYDIINTRILERESNPQILRAKTMVEQEIVSPEEFSPVSPQYSRLLRYNTYHRPYMLKEFDQILSLG